MRKEFDKAEKATARAISIAPNYADGYGLLALISNNLGQAERAIELITKGMQLNPYYTWDYPYNLGCAYYFLGNYDAAIVALEGAQERNENVVPIKLFLAASYAKANRQDDAEWTIDQIQMLSPAATISHTEKTIPFANPEYKRALLVDLRKAGLPE
jgi:adenylate cyclase